MEVRFKVPYFRPYVVGIFPFQSNLGSWRSPIDSMARLHGTAGCPWHAREIQEVQQETSET